MNESIENILLRRSIRKYKEEQISESDLNTILECAKHTPSGCNRQPWAFIVIQNKELIDEMSKDCFEENMKKGLSRYVNKEYYSPFHNAPTVIFILKKNEELYADYDCGMAAENIVLSANALSLGSCILADALAIFSENYKDKYYSKFEIPDNYIPYLAISIGYVDETPNERIFKETMIKIIK